MRARGLQKPQKPGTTTKPDLQEQSLERRLESVKHYLWHGNSGAALEGIDDLIGELEAWDVDENGDKIGRPDSDGDARMLKYVREMYTYIANNCGFIVNYRERYGSGERISTGFVESAVNQVVSKRLVLKQQMQVLNGDWEGTFR